ncbi:MAG: neuromedin U [Planctomycetota bacterium]
MIMFRVCLLLLATMAACVALPEQGSPAKSNPPAAAPCAGPQCESVGEAIDSFLGTNPGRRLLAAEAAKGGTDLASAAQNPIASTISVPFESNFNFGADGGVQYVLNIQPVIPMKLSENWNLIHRPVIPLVYDSAALLGAPRPPSTEKNDLGLGDTLYAAYFSPSKPGKWIWGVAPALVIPTSTSRAFGPGNWGLGASAVALRIKKPWLYGGLITNVWTFGDAGDAFLVQPFLTYNLPNGWFLESSPQLSAAWDAPSDQRWQIPIGGGVGKITKIGKQPIALRLHLYGNVVRPDNGPEALLRFTITFLFPKK